MSSETQERIKALEVALNNESRERDFYLKHAERTGNAFGKLMFHSIAKDENEHYQKILELHRKLQAEDRRNTETLAERRSRDKQFGKMVKTVMHDKRKEKGGKN